MLRDPQEYRSGFTRTVLERAAAVGQREVLLRELARSLIMQQRDAAALQVIIDLKAVSERDALYRDMATGHARARRFELAYWSAAYMQAGADRDRVLLTVAEYQLRDGGAVGAGQTATILEPERPELRDAVLRMQALAAAQLDDSRRAWELAAGLSTPAGFAAAMRSIVELQIERNAQTAALESLRFEREVLRRRAGPGYAVAAMAEQLSLLGASTESLQLVQGSEGERAQALAAVARGAARAKRFEEALATLERIPATQRVPVRNAAAFVAQQRILDGIDAASAFEAANAFTPLPAPERSRWVQDTAVQLVRLQYLSRARDVLSYEVDNVLHEPECSEDCPPKPAPDSKRCDFGARDAALCTLATLQARLGFIDDAERTAYHVRSEQALIEILLSIARAQTTAGRGANARRTFARSLSLARLPANNDYLDGVLKAYASWVATDRLHYDAFPDIDAATQELLRLDRGAACRTDGAPLAVATAHAKAGQFAAAFALVQTQLQCQQLDAYLRIYERGMQ